jgi:large conductance mechanosensitive channel
LDGFKKFILRGNVVDLAVGVIIGAAFGAVVTSFVNGVMTPIIGLPGSANFDKLGVCLKGDCPVDAKTGIAGGHFLNYGVFVTALINFLIVAAVVYVAVVRPLQKLMDRMNPVKAEEPAAATKECPECLSNIPAAAVRCAFCTVEQLEPA